MVICLEEKKVHTFRGELLAEIREDKELSQDDLATRLNLSPSTISKYENNENEPPLDVVKQIALALNISVDYLLGITEDEYPAHRSTYFRIPDDSDETLIKELRRYYNYLLSENQ